MTEPLNVDPSQLRNIGGRWYALIPDLQSAPPTSAPGVWPSHAGVQAVTGVAGESTTVLQQGLAGLAGSAQSGGSQYQVAESVNAGGMKPSDFSSILNDLIGAGTTLIQTAPQLVQSVTSAVSSAASGGSSAVSSLVGSLSHGASAASPLGGNASQTALPAIEGQIPPSEEHHNQQQEGG